MSHFASIAPPPPSSSFMPNTKTTETLGKSPCDVHFIQEARMAERRDEPFSQGEERTATRMRAGL